MDGITIAAIAGVGGLVAGGAIAYLLADRAGKQALAKAATDKALAEQRARSAPVLRARTPTPARHPACSSAEAVDDFGRAAELEPRFHDFWKRRGQALAARPWRARGAV